MTENPLDLYEEFFSDPMNERSEVLVEVIAFLAFVSILVLLVVSLFS